MLILGRNSILEALASGRTFDKAIVQKDAEGGSAREVLSKLKQAKVKLQIVEKSVLDKLVESGKHQGFAAYVTDYKYSSLEELLEGDARKTIVILDEINDPHNFGSIIRTAECLGASIIIGKNRSVGVTDTVERISQGAISHVKIARVTNINDAIREIKKRNIWVMAAEAGGGDIAKTNLKGDIAIIIGSEGEGVSRLTKELADGIVSIPMHGNVNSLNAGVAAGIVLYEIMRQNA